MKHILTILAASLVIGSAGAQSDADISTMLQNNERSQELLLQNSRQILEKLSGIESSLGEKPAFSAAVNLEDRIKALEAKLAELPAPAAVESEEGAPAAAPSDTLQLNINIVWILITGALVFFMQAGFAMLEVGFTRSKNAINVCMKNFLDFSVGALCFLFVGFALMFGASAGGWIGTGPFWLSSLDGKDSFWAFWFFQAMFAGTAATIISGAMAERTKFVGYLIYTAFITSLLYPILGHWAWGSFGGGFGYGGDKGWLESMGYVDFAGSSVVHCIGGAAALAGVVVLGPRIGRFSKSGATLLSGHNLPLATLGTFILWFGWFGFNAGSTLIGDASIGRIAVNTTIAPSAGALAAMITIWITHGRPDLGATLNGALGGLVGITANCHMVVPASAAVIGLIAGVIATLAAQLLERLKVDDAVGASPVHLFCGVWGVLAVALFNEKGFSPESLGIQALGAFSIAVGAFVASYLVFQLINVTIGLRASDEEQDLGLDFTEHSATAYADFLTGEQSIVDTLRDKAEATKP
jgi:Amt family ammonium transporter